MYFPALDNRDKIELTAGVKARTFWGENMLLALVDLEAHAVIPTHKHVHEQSGVVLQGQLQFTIAHETRDLKPGDIYLIPSSIEHSVVVGSQPARVVDIFSPVREEYKY